MNVNGGYKFEKYVAKIFEEAGYSVEFGKSLENRICDIIAEKETKKYCIEVKFSPIIERAVEQVCIVACDYNMIPVVVSAYVIDNKIKKIYQKKYPQMIVIDIKNLLFAVKDRMKLYNELVAMLPYSIDNIELQEGFVKLDSIQHDDYTASLIKEMELCEAGRTKFRKYENLCYDLLKNVFSDDLALWREQQKSNKELYRFDLLCRIKDGNQKTFWSIIEKYFNSKYVIFEFKNYTEKITQKEIYTTERYLYAKALRSVAIIVSANGYEENAYWAAKGSLRENGKLILLLKSEDLIAMNKIKSEQEDPANYLLERLDDLLLELEK